MTGGLRSRNLRRFASVPLALLLWPFVQAMPRRRGLWVFGYVHGYKDNPRYLFEHVVRRAPDGVVPVWLAQTDAEVALVRALGHPSVRKGSPRGWWLQLRAGTVVLGFGPSDLSRPLIGRAIIVQTWHGAPFKKIHADFPSGDELFPASMAAGRLLNGLVRWRTNAGRSKVRLVPSQSPAVSERFQSAFCIGPEAAPVLGTPRADITGATGPEADAEAGALKASFLPAELEGSRLILYAPTWRDGRSEAFLAEGLDIEALDALLTGHDAVLLIRMHPQGDTQVFQRAGVGSTTRVVLGGEEQVDVNVLLRAVDLLVTDYSSICVDYSILDRPIVYFMPDLEEYEAGRGWYERPSLVTGGLQATSWTELQDALGSALEDPADFVAPVRGVRARYFAHDDTNSCARITDRMLVLSGLAP